MNAFTYRGHHQSEFQCGYAPEQGERGDWMNDFDTSEVEFDSRDGGYYFGTHIAPRVFELPCFYENIDNRTKEKLVQWLDPRKSGTLVFDERPYAKYEVVPTKKIEFREYGHYDETGTLRRSATFTITFTAYSPFAELDLTGTDSITAAYKDEWVLPDAALPSAPSPEATQFVVYNPGTEKADTIIRIAGASGDKMTIRNAATEQECTIMGMTRGNTTDANKWIEIDSATGQVWLVGAATRELSFVFHDDGYIQIAPCSPYIGANISYTTGSRTITSTEDVFTEEMVGQYVYLAGNWRYIGQVTDSKTAVLNAEMGSTGTGYGYIVPMNLITISGDGVELTKLEVEVKPRVR